MSRPSIAPFIVLALAAWLPAGAGARPAGQAKPAAPLTDLDAFMARVLERSCGGPVVAAAE